MFRFDREKILPLFLKKYKTTKDLAKKSGVNPVTVNRAVNGLPIQAFVVDKIACALNIDALDYLLAPAQMKGGI